MCQTLRVGLIQSAGQGLSDTDQPFAGRLRAGTERTQIAWVENVVAVRKGSWPRRTGNLFRSAGALSPESIQDADAVRPLGLCVAGSASYQMIEISTCTLTQ